MPNFVLTGPLGNLRVQLNLLGRHNVANALAAAAAAHALGITAEAVVAGLQSLQPVKGRAVAQMLANGVRLIDDSYNANPASICAAIDVLASFAGRTILVLGTWVSWASGPSRGTAMSVPTRRARSTPSMPLGH